MRIEHGHLELGPLLTGVAAVLLGCSESSAPTLPDVRGGPDRPAFLAMPSAEFSWDQTQLGPTDMGSSRGRICLLTRITGDFQGGGEFVQIVSNGGHWWLGGGSLQQGVGARARCLAVNGYSDEYTVTVTSGKGVAGLDPLPAVCGFTRVSGRFKTLYLNGDAVTIDPAPGGSQLIVSSASGEWLSAGSRCFTGAKNTVSKKWSEGIPIPVPIVSGNAYCFLTEIAGDFEGGGEFLEIVQYLNFWSINGGTQQEGLEGRGTCVT